MGCYLEATAYLNLSNLYLIFTIKYRFSSNEIACYFTKPYADLSHVRDHRIA